MLRAPRAEETLLITAYRQLSATERATVLRHAAELRQAAEDAIRSPTTTPLPPQPRPRH